MRDLLQRLTNTTKDFFQRLTHTTRDFLKKLTDTTRDFFQQLTDTTKTSSRESLEPKTYFHNIETIVVTNVTNVNTMQSVVIYYTVMGNLSTKENSNNFNGKHI